MSRRSEHPNLTTSRAGFWQLLDSLMREYRVSDDLDAPALSDPISFTHDTRTDYAPTDVSRCSTDSDGGAQVAAPLLGLLGMESVLPFDLTESVLMADDGGAMADFFDVFHARVVRLVHAAWRMFGPNGTDAFRKGLRSFAGEDAFSPEAPEASEEQLFDLGLSDVVACTPEYVDVAALELLLARAFPDLGARVSIGDRVFVRKSVAERSPLGIGRNILGGGGSYGRGAWDPVGTLRISTREFTDVSSLLPGGEVHSRLGAFASEWMSHCPEVELDVPMPGAEASWTRLGGARGARLGFDAQVTRRKPEKVRLRVKVATASARVPVRYVDDE